MGATLWAKTATALGLTSPAGVVALVAPATCVAEAVTAASATEGPQGSPVGQDLGALIRLRRLQVGVIAVFNRVSCRLFDRNGM